MFYTNAPIRLHAKCTCILEMIQQSNNRIEDHKSTLRRISSQSWWEFNPWKEGELEEAIAWQESVSNRLVNYYKKTLEKIKERDLVREPYTQLQNQ